jgi:hypothetical protein
MKYLLVICPSRGRPKAMGEMLDSFYKTKSEETNMVVYLNKDDPVFQKYECLKNTRDDTQVILGDRMYLAEACNFIWRMYPNYKYYTIINDDHFLVTPQWDKRLAEIVETKGQGWGMACADDHLTNWKEYQHPSGFVMSGNIPKTLGYLIYPTFQHIGIDNFYQMVLQGIDRLFYTKDIVIEHRHWINGKRLLDENYKFVYGAEQQQYGMRAIMEYKLKQYKNDIDKLKEAMKKEGKE